jgi:zinc protease
MASLSRPIELQLSNGIPVILQHLEGEVAATYWWNQVGSADERPEQAGFSHFLEHMLFKDAAAKETGKASTGQMASAIEGLGGDINAYTSFDQTVYHVTCAAQHWIKVIDAFGPMSKPQKFLKQDFEREREVILEELKKNEDSPGRMLFQSLFAETFRSHPYGRPVIGYVKTLKKAKVTDLEAYYRSHYISARMGLILVGPLLDSRGQLRKDILKALEKHFGQKIIKKNLKAPPSLRKNEEAQRKSATFRILPFDVTTMSAAIAFRVPELSHEDVPALDVLAGILGMGESSRLYQALFYGQSLVTEASAGLYVPRDPGMFYAQVDFEKPEQTETVTRALFEELKKVKENPPTMEELSRVITNAESERMYASQTADGMASRLGFLRFMMGDLQHDREYLDLLRAVKPEDVIEVAKKYLVPERMSGVLMAPTSAGLKEWKGFEAAESILGSERPAIPKAKRAPHGEGIEVFRTAEGMQVLYRENRASPVFSIHTAALGGLRGELLHPVRDADRDWGASHLMGMTLTKGTSALGARQIAAQVEGAAASLDGFSGRNTVGAQLTGLVRDWSSLSSLFSEVLVDSRFPEEEVEHSRRVVLDSVRSIEDHSSQLSTKLFLEQLFDSHPYGRLTIGSEQSVSQIDSATLLKLRERWFRPERMVVAISGGIRRSEVERWLNDLDHNLRKNVGPKNEGPEHKRLSDPVLKAPRWVEKSLGREQTHILVGGVGLRVDSPDRDAIRLLQNVLGGQSGRLFIELREKRSLAYTVAPVVFEGVEAGYIGTYIASSSSKKKEAIEGIKRVLEDFAAKGPTPSELQRAREYYLGRRAMDLQSDSAVASSLSLEAVYGLPNRTADQVARDLKAVTAKKVQEVCRKYLVERPMVTVAVG